MADVDFVGEHKRVCLDYLPELGIGDWVITHAGYALTKLTPETAASTLQTMRDVGLLEEVTLP
jgi:hydrogenase expression/formation protein HypC